MSVDTTERMNAISALLAKAGWAGATTQQVRQIPDLAPAVIKSLFLQESGGSLPGDLAAWRLISS